MMLCNSVFRGHPANFHTWCQKYALSLKGLTFSLKPAVTSIPTLSQPGMFQTFASISSLLSSPPQNMPTGTMYKTFINPNHKIFRVRVKLVTEHTVFCRKFNLLSQFLHFLGVTVLGHIGNITFRVFFVK